jgi:hypothetical protein
MRGLRRLWRRHSRGMPSPRLRGEGRVRGRPCFAGLACREQRPNLRLPLILTFSPYTGRRDESGPMAQILETPGSQSGGGHEAGAPRRTPKRGGNTYRYRSQKSGSTAAARSSREYLTGGPDGSAFPAAAEYDPPTRRRPSTRERWAPRLAWIASLRSR